MLIYLFRSCSLLTILLISFVFSLPSTELKSFDVIDSRRNTLYTGGTKEHHCFNFLNGIRVYVRGTYGNYGYFEGAVDRNDPLSFHINWYETAGNMRATAGSAILNYSSTWNAVTGPYWTSGSGDMNDSYKSWYSSNGQFVADDSTIAGSDILLTKCLYSGLNYEDTRNSISVLSDQSIISTSSSGFNTLCKVPVGGLGVWLGTYQYEYTQDVDGITGIETGNYGLDSLAYLVKSGMGFTGQWIADTGPKEGERGTNLYMILSRSSKQIMIGYYCFINSQNIRTQCEYESYEILSSSSSSSSSSPTYSSLLGSCPSLYRSGESLQSLYSFSREGYRATSHCESSKEREQERAGWVVAIVFMIFSVVLICTFFFIVITARNQKAALVLPS